MMKLKRRIIFACCGILLLVASSLARDHNNKETTQSKMQGRKQEQRRNMMPGGYFPVEDYTDDRVVNAANMAVSQLTTAATAATVTYSFAAGLQGRNVTHKIVKAFQQVVAGKNYRFILMLQDADTAECLGAFAVTVYDNFGTLQVTAWGQEVSCERAKANLENADDFDDSATGEHFNGSS
jgi:hypothetical protein